MDLRREMDIEQLRRVALAQQVQIEQLLRVLSAQAAELGALKGNDRVIVLPHEGMLPDCLNEIAPREARFGGPDGLAAERGREDNVSCGPTPITPLPLYSLRSEHRRCSLSTLHGAAPSELGERAL